MQLPDHISDDARVLGKKLLDEYEINDIAGVAILIKILEAWDTADNAQKIINKQGMMIVDRFGQSKPNGLLPVLRDARSQFLAGIKALHLEITEPENEIGRPAGQGKRM